MINQKLPQRRHYEVLSGSYQNIIAPLLDRYTQFKSLEFAGKLLIAIYNSFPTKLPVIKVQERFNLPIYQGFGKWLEDIKRKLL